MDGFAFSSCGLATSKCMVALDSDQDDYRSESRNTNKCPSQDYPHPNDHAKHTRNTIFAVTREARLDFLILVYSALGRTHKPQKSRLASIRNMLTLFSRKSDRYILFSRSELLIESETCSTESLEARSAESRSDVASNARAAQADANLDQGCTVLNNGADVT